MFAQRHVLFAALLATSIYPGSLFAGGHDTILNKLGAISVIASTIPGNGDVNPYGLARVPKSSGKLQAGHYLVSNFNAGSNLQGTGTTIVDIAPNGTMSLFAQIDASSLPGPCPGGVGLTTALTVLRTGWVIVGSLPTSDGTSATAQAGCLIVLDNQGKPVETINGSLINGPWDMTALDGERQAVLFVANVLNGTLAGGGDIVNQGNVVRVNLKVSKDGMPELESLTVVGKGYAERTDPAALVIGPTGLALSPSGGNSGYDDWDGQGKHHEDGEPVLYLADSLNDRILAITDPLSRDLPAVQDNVLSEGGSLNDPLGLTVAPNGHILAVNGNDGYITEITPRGQQIAKKLIDASGAPAGAGALFGVLYTPGVGVVFVDDATNTLNLLH